MSENNTPAMSLDNFKKTAEYLALSDLQRTWIVKLIMTGDVRQATVESYSKAKRLGSNYITQLGSKNLASPHVRNALSTYYGWDDKQKFMADLEANIRTAKGADKVSLLSLKARMLGLVSGDDSALSAPKPASDWKIGQHVQQRDGNGVIHHGIILALNANGEPSQIEEIRA